MLNLSVVLCNRRCSVESLLIKRIPVVTKKEVSCDDRRAIKVLFDTYWSSNGWLDEQSRATPPADLEYAKRAGLMFDPVYLTHSDIVSQATAIVRVSDRQTITEAFVVSLTTRRLDYRSALGSFAVLQHFPEHQTPCAGSRCRICGVYIRDVDKVDLNVLNFERCKWGGVRHDQPLYASFDLRLFGKLPKVKPDAADVKCFKAVLAAIEKVPADTPSARLEKHLSKVIKSNKSERDNLIGILGYCGILATKAHEGYRNHFVAVADRMLPSRRFIDMAYPACWWRRSDGVNQEALEYWFGHLL